MAMKLRALDYGYIHRTSSLSSSCYMKKTIPRLAISCEQHQHDLKGKSVAVVGLGKSGKAAARLALARGASVLAFDQNQKLGLLEHDPLFENHSGLKTFLGDFDGRTLKEADVVVVSPGVPLEKHDLSSLLQSGKRIMSELDFAAQVLPDSVKILAVTGTNGKSTVTTFAGQMLNHLGISTYVGGNLGNPLSEAAFQCVTFPSKPMFQAAVVEVSSYQMEVPRKYFNPSVAVILNLTPDHLERHKTMKNYAKAKCSLFSQMTNSKLAILPFDQWYARLENIIENHGGDNPLCRVELEKIEVEGVTPHCILDAYSAGDQHLNEAIRENMEELNLAWIGATPGVEIDMDTKVANLEVPVIGIASQLQLHGMKLMGTHNYYNAAVAALSVLGLDMGVNVKAIGSTIEKLRAPPHRMQIVRIDTHGITWVDDSKATNVEATYAGLRGLKEQKCVVLLGGLAKVLVGKESNGFELLIETLKDHRCVITFGSSGSLIQKTLCDNHLPIPCIRAVGLKDAVRRAREVAKSGDTILLSPGCASFDEFRNFEHRGTTFQELAFSV